MYRMERKEILAHKGRRETLGKKATQVSRVRKDCKDCKDCRAKKATRESKALQELMERAVIHTLLMPIVRMERRILVYRTVTENILGCIQTILQQIVQIQMITHGLL